ncbi:hypothetical protein [Sulfurospirillum barnesii]|uniref:Uncharacterized protein n=1 Tax=Sulfurospirillum barnesii (strain ATCC 700032 / DSM 10660 / SES-3) TaxID=760154 RepID=I3XVK9_SULBS|nr:hypothetical protein [Sulfurospirillum barnesii]AFL67983.1 hypothetical protein Sulba_0676 [Sulfurospirillum barnesii SES-3]
MTNLSVSEKLALEEVFECLKEGNCRKMGLSKKLFSHRIMRLLMFARRKFLHVKR